MKGYSISTHWDYKSASKQDRGRLGSRSTTRVEANAISDVPILPNEANAISDIPILPNEANAISDIPILPNEANAIGDVPILPNEANASSDIPILPSELSWRRGDTQTHENRARMLA
jgi:hypothetical protein